MGVGGGVWWVMWRAGVAAVGGRRVEVCDANM